MINKEIEAKKELMEFSRKLNDDYDEKKKEREFKYFKLKQKLMQDGTNHLWDMKKEFFEMLHTRQVERMNLAIQLKTDFITNKK